jgi:hypothetical protein
MINLISLKHYEHIDKWVCIYSCIINNKSLFILVLYCTLLASSQSETEKSKIEEKMRNDSELVWILQALSETDRNDAVQVSFFLYS